MIKNIIFDFGNVLFDLDLDKIEQGFRQLFGPSYAQASEKLLRDNVFHRYEVGEITSAEFIEAIRLSAPPHPPHDAIVQVWNSIFLQMPKERFELLLSLKNRYKVFLLSNINDLHATWIDEYLVREHGIHDFKDRYFDGVYYSHLVRLRKPDLQIYEYMLEDAKINPEESIFIDDLLPNIQAAEKVRIQGLLHPLGDNIIQKMQPFLS
jgi:putative hydrolase of the HAD superfamily